MPTYVNRECPHCGHLMDHHIPVWDYVLILGPDRMTCQKCGKQSLTGCRYWAELTFGWKYQVVRGVLISILMFGAMFWVMFFTLTAVLVANNLLSLSVSDDVAIRFILLLSLFLSIVYHGFRLKKLATPQSEDHAITKGKP